MTYLEMIAAIVAAEKAHGVHDLDAISREILQTIASANLLSVRMRMKDLNRIASFPTVQQHVQKLTADGWIARAEDPADKRVALLHATPKAMKAFQQMSEELDRPPSHIKRESCETCISKIRSLAFSEFEAQFKDFERQFKKVDH